MFNWIYLFFGANKQKNVPTGVLTFSLLVKSTLMQKFKAIEECNCTKCFPNQFLNPVLFREQPNSQEKENVLRLSGLVYPFLITLMLFLSKSNTRAFCSQNPLCAFCNPATMRCCKPNVVRQPGSDTSLGVSSLVALEIQQDDSSAAGGREDIAIPSKPHSR